MPPRLRETLRRIARPLAIVALFYVGFCAFMAWNKERLLFPDHSRERAAGRIAPAGFETWWQTMRDGTRVEGWWRPAPSASPETPGPAVIVFHGNGELIDDSIDFADAWHARGVSVLLAEYRGYGRSEGRPGIATCRADAVEWFDRVAARPEVRPDLVLTHGFSLGGVFAAELAALRPVAGLALESSPASLREAARERGVWLLLTRERFDAEAVLRALPAGIPVLLTHGTDDHVVGFRHHRRLATARPAALISTDTYTHTPLALGRPSLLDALLDAARRHADKGLASPSPLSAR
jgi:fermentation-respiration switch protein FrsA (DUF1100 family)